MSTRILLLLEMEEISLIRKSIGGAIFLLNSITFSVISNAIFGRSKCYLKALLCINISY